MAVANNADEYAKTRLGVYFDGNPATLTGQCVSLVKWFLQEMTSVPDPQAARGHAKDYGANLVAQGHAAVVAAANRKRGDIVVWKKDGGGYGHIGVLLSNDQIFEENVGLVGVPSKHIYDDKGNYVTTVYASMTNPLYSSWRKGDPTFYRVNTYNEGSSAMTKAEAEDMRNVLRVLNSEVKGWDRNKVHKGEYDKKEIEYLMTLSTKPSLAIAKYSQQAWDEGVKYRAGIDSLKSELEAAKKRIKELEAQGTGKFVKITDLYIKEK